MYVRTDSSRVAEIHDLLANAANPTAPNDVDISQPSDALEARAQAAGAFNGLFIGLGAVSLLVGVDGVANIMSISVLERRSEIGLRRALGATGGHIRVYDGRRARRVGPTRRRELGRPPPRGGDRA